ncbi:hypothetical protein [Siminovitchia terrae]|uniref:hypothetical protein n=1 Tax=Siminovitchia terrae TaxID=1914933 RepID=UPI0028B062FA|nr:hypothetical protein [Siminovitchia terrae]
MKKRMAVLLLSLFFVFGLAACGNNESDNKTPVTAENSAEKTNDNNDNNDKKDEGQKEQTAKTELKEEQIGMTMDEFKTRYNEKVPSDDQIDFQMGDYNWDKKDDGISTAGFEFGEDYVITGMANTGNEELKAVLLEVKGGDSTRQTAFDLIRAIMRSSNPELTTENIDELMKDLGLTNPDGDGNNTVSQTARDGLKYLVNDERSHWLEFVVANETDTDFEAE